MIFSNVKYIYEILSSILVIHLKWISLQKVYILWIYNNITL